MFCSSCGVAVAQGLTYCNYCGAKLGAARAESVKAPEVRPETLIGAMVFAFILGLLAITLLIGVMKTVLEVGSGVVLGFAMMCFLILLSLEGVFIRLLLRRLQAREHPVNAVQSRGQSTNELDAAQARALPEPLPSVTEHTTRAFEPMYTERRSK